MDPVDQTVQDSASRGSWAAIAALVVWALIALAKSDKTPPWLTPPPAWRPLVAVLLGQVYAVLEAGVHGLPWGAAVVRGFIVAAVAIAGQELGSKLAGGVTTPPMLCLALLLSGCSSLTPAQSGALKASVPKIAGAGCAIVKSFIDADWVKFVCRVVEGGGISNMGTGPAGIDARPAQTVEVEVLVPREQADAFAKANPQ